MLSWGALHLDQNSLNTQPEVVAFFAPPVDIPVLLSRGRDPGGPLGRSSLQEEGLLAVDVALTRALR